jgi:large subunit ribosomal protein L9
MKVILNQTVPKLGKQGQVVTVADGFARNFLFPKRLARIADKSGMAELERAQQKLAADMEKTKGNAEKLAGKLTGGVIRLVGSTAKGSTKLFGAITSQDIADAVKKELGVEVEKRAVALMHPIKRLGVYDVMIDLHRDVDATIKVEVANEDGFLGIEEVKEELKPEPAEANVELAADEAASEEPVVEEEPVEA